MSVSAVVTEAKYRLNRASVLLSKAVAEHPEYSLAGERCRELLQESKSWIEEYEEEVKAYERDNPQ